MHAHTDVYAPLRSVPASAGLSVCSVWAAPLLQNVPRVVLFSSLLGGGRGLPQPPPLFRVLDDVLFLGWELADVFFFLVVLAWLFSLLSLASAWHPGCCVVLQPVRSLWDWQWSSCSLARSSAPLNRCCGDEGASQMVAAHHVIYCLRYWR